MKNVLILGGTGGLGYAISSQFNNSDFKITKLGSAFADVRSLPHLQQVFTNVNPDIIINFAGVNQDGFIHKLDSSFSKMIDVNVTGAVNIAAAALPGMRARGYGRLIYISSVLSTKDVLGTAVYSASKAFVDRFVKNISAENISKGITANSIQLGYFDGGMTNRLHDPEKIKNSIGLKRWGTIEELHQTIEFIISTEYLTGANIQLNGGLCF